MNRRNFLTLATALPLLTVYAPASADDAFWNRVFAVMPPELAALAVTPEYRVQILAQYRKNDSRQ